MSMSPLSMMKRRHCCCDLGIELSCACAVWHRFFGHDGEMKTLHVTGETNLVKAWLNDLNGRDLVHHLGSLADVMLSTDAKLTLGACGVVADCDQRQEDEARDTIALVSPSDTPLPLQLNECFASGTGKQFLSQAKTSQIQRSMDTAKATELVITSATVERDHVIQLDSVIQARPLAQGQRAKEQRLF